MEIMEEGNLMDRVHILIQRDFEYYKQKQKVLQDTICAGVVGGRLDFPRHASFAAVKLMLWWEEEYFAAFREGSGLVQNISKNAKNDGEIPENSDNIVKVSDPYKFVSAVTKSADQLLKHLHVLTQEALDHADLTVLTGTIGAAALLRNCLWCYIQQQSSTQSQNSRQKHNIQLLQTSHKEYQEMTEALAERLLDLHCRLLSLYILQDAESLDWESTKSFFESERGSYIVQMWWLYMQGTRQNLWNTVPPKIAQRVFAGMLNESLTILSVRYTQACPSECRSTLYAVDISNILLCVMELLPAICERGDELAGLALNTQTKIIRDVHAKCQELFSCLILRCCPLDTLYKLFRKGCSNLDISRTRNAGPSPWLVFTSPQLFPTYPKNVIQMKDLNADAATALELSVLLIQPQPNWSLLLKVLLMRDCKLINLIFRQIMKQFPHFPQMRSDKSATRCEYFLCTDEGLCKNIQHASGKLTSADADSIIMAITHIFLVVGNSEDISRVLLPVVEASDKDWAVCFDRRQVWNQKRPAWYEAILAVLNPLMPHVISTAVGAVQTGASMYQAMSVILACIHQLWDCVPSCLTRVSMQIKEMLPSCITPLGNSVLLQVLASALYTALLDTSEASRQQGALGSPEVPAGPQSPDRTSAGADAARSSADAARNSADAIALAVAESVCSIDEDNKHTEEIDELLDYAEKNYRDDDDFNEGCRRIESSQQMTEILASDILMTIEGKRALKVLHQFVCSNHDWLYANLGVSGGDTSQLPGNMSPVAQPLLYTMFHIKDRAFDQLLSGEWKPNWHHLLKIPVGLSIERLWSHVSKRWEFQLPDPSSLPAHDAQIVSAVTSVLKQN